MKNKKVIILSAIMAICLLIIIIPMTCKTTDEQKIDKLYNTFVKDYTKQGEVLVGLAKLKKSDDVAVSNKAKEYYEKVLQNANDKGIIDDIKKKFDSIDGKYAKFYVEDLQVIKSDSIHYQEAQELINELNTKEKEDNSDEGNSEQYAISIEYYTKHTTAGTERLNIRVRNTSGQSIEYLALDIFEVNKNGDVVNSEWANTSSLILDNATVSIDTYFDYQLSESDLNFSIRDIRYK